MPNDQKLTTEQAFKVGFLTRCIEEKLTDDQILDRINHGLGIKEAVDVLGPAKDAVKFVGEGLGGLAGATLVGLPIGVGAAGGYLASKATTNDELDADSIKREELIDAYNHLADEAERRAKLKRKLGLLK